MGSTRPQELQASRSLQKHSNIAEKACRRMQRLSKIYEW